MDLRCVDGEQPPNADQYEAICQFFGWTDAADAFRNSS